MSSVLSRRLQSGIQGSWQLRSTQIQQDHLLEQSTKGLGDVSNLVAMTGASFAYRLSKLTLLEGMAGLGLSRFASPFAMNSVASSAALAGEVSVYRILSFQDRKNSSSSDYIHFSTLRLFGALAQNTNPVFLNILQDTGFVAAHHLAYGLGFTTKPEGTFFSQMLEAHVMNWQMKFGLAATHRFFPALSLHERSIQVRMESSLQPVSVQVNPFRFVPTHFYSPYTRLLGKLLYEGTIQEKAWQVRCLDFEEARSDVEVRRSRQEFLEEMDGGYRIDDRYYVLYLEGQVAGSYNVYLHDHLPRAFGNGIHIFNKFRSIGGLGSILREAALANLKAEGYLHIEYDVLHRGASQRFQAKLEGRPGVRLLRSLHDPVRIDQVHINLIAFEPQVDPLAMLEHSVARK